MKIATLQLNFTAGAVQSNADMILQEAKRAYVAGARIIITPELALCGCSESDLLLRDDFLSACKEAVERIASSLAEYPDLYLLLGHPLMMMSKNSLPGCYNAVSLIHGGRIEQRYTKEKLLNTGTGGESRYFSVQKDELVFEVDDIRYGVLIGADVLSLEDSAPVHRAITAGAQILLVLSAQPYFQGDAFEDTVGNIAKSLQKPIIVAQAIGAQDELVFSGASFAMDGKGVVQARAPSFDENVFYADVTAPEFQIKGVLTPCYDEQESLWRALVLGLRDYVRKNGFSRVVLGLSGGMDSALVLAIAVDALGTENVNTVMMPSAYTSQLSLDVAAEMAAKLGVAHDVIPITQGYTALQETLAPFFSRNPSVFQIDTTEENLQARVRGIILMAISNRTGALVLASGNKSEVATGYCTLYGDTVGGFAVIKDVYKTGVYALARWRNEHDVFGRGKAPIPEAIITRAPSAELRPGQTDQDSLPPYDVLDGILELYIEQNLSVENIVDAGYTREDVEKVARLIKISEYKRQQAPLGTKVSSRSFGADWRYTITSKYQA